MITGGKLPVNMNDESQAHTHRKWFIKSSKGVGYKFMTACLKEPIYLSGKVSSPKMSIIKFKCRHIKPTWRDIGIYLESWLCLRHTAQYNLETLKGKSGSFWASSIHCLMWNRFGLKGIYHSFKCLITVTIFLLKARKHRKYRILSNADMLILYPFMQYLTHSTPLQSPSLFRSFWLPTIPFKHYCSL